MSVNGVRCLTCNTVIVSKHRHDWQGCACGLKSDTFIYVDGGNDYRRMGAGPKAHWESLEGDQ